MPEHRAVVDQDPEFHETLGRCITRWATVDEALFDLCHAALQTDEIRAAIVFYRTPGLDARLTLTVELVRSRFPEPERKSGHKGPIAQEWDRIVKGVRDLLPIRNSLAHHPITAIPEITAHADGKSPVRLSARIVLEVSRGYHEQLRKRGADPTPIDQAALQRHLEAVQAIASRLAAFLKNLPTAHRLTPKQVLLQPETKSTRTKQE